jgi:hypothetical protein
VATSRARSSDIKLIVSATFAVILAGLFIAGGMLVATSSGSRNPICGSLNVGKASAVRDSVQTHGPSFVTNGASCGFWLALEDGTVVAYRVEQPSGCSLNLRDRATRWVCGGNDIATKDLATYDVRYVPIGATEAIIVDLSPSTTTTTPSTTPSTTTTTVKR